MAPRSRRCTSVGDAKMIVVTRGRTAVQPDDMVGLRIDPAKVHVFDHAAPPPASTRRRSRSHNVELAHVARAFELAGTRAGR